MTEDQNGFFRPKGKADAVLDTDAYNEIDDQFAISYLLASSGRVSVKAFYAAPFLNHKSENPRDGMEKSYREILRLLELADRPELQPYTFRGSEYYMPDEKTPVPSDASADLAARAMAYSAEDPLYVLSIGAITNVASAIVAAPEIIDRIVVVWLGGNATYWPDTREFNMSQDIAAARVVFGSGVRLVQLPCMGVVEMLRTTRPELEFWLRGKNRLCDYLIDNTVAEAESYAEGKPWSRVIWDIAAVAWLLDADGRMTDQIMIPAPLPGYDNRYQFNALEHRITCVRHIDRDAVFESLFSGLADMK